MRIQFGTGFVYFIPLGGNLPTPSSPRRPATLQDFDFQNTATIKDLRGDHQYPDDTAVSDKKATWKIGSGRFDIDLWNNLFGGEVLNTGGEPPEVQEAGTVPASSPYQITVAQSASFVMDLGVENSSTGQPFARVAAGPVTGEYAVNQSTGVYTFAVADVGIAVLISYTYAIVTGTNVIEMNRIQGYGPSFEIIVAETYDEQTAGVPNYIHLYKAKCTKFSQPLKRVDYLISDIEGEAYSNAAGQVYQLYED